MHPRSLKETSVMVIPQNRLASLRIKDLDLLDFIGELVHVLSELGYSWSLGGNALAADLLRALPFGVKDIVTLLVALQLPTPKTSEVQVRLSILIYEACRVNTVASLDGLWVGSERSLRLITDGNTDAEDSLLISGGEVEVEFSVLLSGIGSPELLGNPGDVFCLKNNTVVNDLSWWVEALSAEDMVIGHVILIAIVVELDIGLTVVRRIDVDLAIEDMRRRVGTVDVGDERRHDL